ncbi:hypothetical protein [Sanguibacter antarcticus]|uniref:Uncharacterized protein n=1 Tax=Sanguibacter antarcticus TaxID=372484 RepID=A0A2A9E7L3_9MICO|nr:hypothetical protein [Sanguibacter antarcticus]PFG34551.1 hypothetical protein ATL42_2465 [Sanguibacter antarcticus]
MTEQEARTLRDHLAAALDAAAPGVDARLDTDPQAHLDLVAVTQKATTETDALLRAAVDSARGAGCTWEQIGGVLGMTRQAAQQRYGRRSEDLVATGPHTMTLAPLTAFNEMRVLERAGHHGWHSIGYGAFFHVVTHSEQQWEHARTTFRSGAPSGEGWEKVGAGWGWWTYYARPLTSTALPGPDDVRDLLDG